MPTPANPHARPLASPFYAIADADLCARAGWTLDDFAQACLDGGARLLQIRAKRAPSGWLLDTTARIVERAAAAGGAVVIVNDRADIARLAGAGGVHVGQTDLSPAAVRRVAGEAALVGLSTHTIEELDRAIAEPVSHVAVGPVFGTTTKETGRRALGLARVRAVADRAAPSRLPLVAIGGITLDRAEAVIASGASAVAVIGDLLATGDPRGRVAAYLRLLSRV